MPAKNQAYEKWMRRALALAKKGEGYTSPNPMVGSVIVKRGKVLGQGYHQKAGEPHAEKNALADAKAKGNKVEGATVFVTLEPCCHFGKTPPCVDALIEAKVGRVVIGSVDKNPCVAGEGILKLRNHGIEVVVGVLEGPCTKLNEAFFHKIVTGKPLVFAKAACSLDGKIATRTGHSQWISGEKALKYAHQLRARLDAICVGLGTVLADDPQLTYRGPRKSGHPLRVILDSRCRIPLSAKVVSGNLPGKTLIVTTKKAAKKRMEALQKRPGVEVAVVPDKQGHVDIAALVDLIGAMGLNSLLIEGGGTVMAAAIDAAVIDQMRMVIAPMIIGGKDAVPVIAGKGVATLDEALRLDQVKVGRLGKDLLIRGRVVKRPELSCEIDPTE